MFNDDDMAVTGLVGHTKRFKIYKRINLFLSPYSHSNFKSLIKISLHAPLVSLFIEP